MPSRNDQRILKHVLNTVPTKRRIFSPLTLNLAYKWLKKLRVMMSSNLDRILFPMREEWQSCKPRKPLKDTGPLSIHSHPALVHPRAAIERPAIARAATRQGWPGYATAIPAGSRYIPTRPWSILVPLSSVRLSLGRQRGKAGPGYSMAVPAGTRCTPTRPWSILVPLSSVRLSPGRHRGKAGPGYATAIPAGSRYTPTRTRSILVPLSSVRLSPGRQRGKAGPGYATAIPASSRYTPTRPWSTLVSLSSGEVSRRR